MTANCFFTFHPLQHVRITAYGLNYDARVARCYLSPSNLKSYEVEYAADGEMKRGDFYEDELIERIA